MLNKHTVVHIILKIHFLLKIHLVKVTDLSTNVRDLIDATPHTSPSNVSTAAIKASVKNNLRGVAKNATQQIIDDSNIPEDAKEYIKSFISSTHRSVDGDYGKIPDD